MRQISTLFILKEKMIQEKAIKEILDNVNWKLIQRAMKDAGWKYFDSKRKPPSIKRLKKAAILNLEAVCTQKCVSSRSGGFVAEKFEDDELRLSFELTSNSSYLEGKNG